MGPTGQPFGARYLIEERVGAGATGVVYRGRVRGEGTPVAVKVLRPELAEDPDVVARFVRERSIVVGVRHPNLVQTLDLVIDGGHAAIVMEWVGGGDVRDDLEAHGPMDEADAARVLRQVLSGLGAVHAAGVVHRDIKPANVLLDEDGGAHLSDFGIGRLLAGQAVTSSAELIGTADYMAPELLRHEPATAAVDVYSAGCMLHELLTGEPPFPGTSIAVILLAHLNAQPQRPAAVSDELWLLLSRMLDKAPTQRPTVPQAIAAIDGAFPELAVPDPQTPAPPTARTVVPLDLDGPVPAPRRQRGRRRTILWAAAALFCLALTVTGGLLFGPQLGSAGPPAADSEPLTTTDPTTSAVNTTTAAPATTTVEAQDAAETTADTSTAAAPTDDTTTPPPPPCPGSPDCACPEAPDCTPPCSPEDPCLPGVPTGLHWLESPGLNIPAWTAPDDGGAEITEYVVTLIDEISGTYTPYVWSPSVVGTRGFECLGLNDPQGEPLYSFTVAATNAVGTGDAAESDATIGYRSTDPALPCFVEEPTDPEAGTGGADGGDGG